MKKIMIILSIIIVASCATAPKDISATYVSPLKYKDYDCDQIALEGASIESRVNFLYASLDNSAKADKRNTAISALLFWPTLFFIDGDSPQGAEYAQLKGEYQALRTVAVQKKCALELKGQFEN
jgi:hypothetical protein